MTTKPSNAPWADGPFALIATPSKRLDDSSHGFVYCASEMENAHNVLIRGLNAIIQQAPHVRDSADPKYNPQDVTTDLLAYVQAWTKAIDHHHSIEESTMFPSPNKFSGKPDFMNEAVHQHELFQGGLEKLLAYASATKPEEHRWEGEGGMKDIIDSFAKDLTDHLYAEIDQFLQTGNLDSDGLRETWDQAEAVAVRAGSLSMLTYEGGTDFPPLPAVLPYLVKYFFAARNGTWRFNPRDWWGQPRPLAFGPE